VDSLRGDPTFVAVLARRLRPGATPDDVVRAWYRDRGFGTPVRGPIVARDVAGFSTDESVERDRPAGRGGA
jgi:hypothetical protein